MAGLRNILIHGYQQIGNDSVRDVVKDHLPDILRSPRFYGQPVGRISAFLQRISRRPRAHKPMDEFKS
ncbi:MAG: HepT-like ribonuclease domain-containing protein [Sedimenticolaceae bacterium]